LWLACRLSLKILMPLVLSAKIGFPVRLYEDRPPRAGDFERLLFR
jgi:hypothetical protein